MFFQTILLQKFYPHHSNCVFLILILPCFVEFRTFLRCLFLLCFDSMFHNGMFVNVNFSFPEHFSTSHLKLIFFVIYSMSIFCVCESGFAILLVLGLLLPTQPQFITVLYYNDFVVYHLHKKH